MSIKLDYDWFPEELPGNVLIGQRSWLYSSFAFRHYRSNKLPGVKVGSDTGLYEGTFFDLGPEGKIEIGNYCTLVGVIIASNHTVRIGDYSFIAHEVVIADSFASTPGTEEKNDTKKDIIIGENVWIGANAVLLAGARIGEGSVVGAAAVVDFEVPPYSLVAGNPARIKGKINI